MIGRKIGRTGIVYGGVAGLCLLLHNVTMIAADRAGAPLIAAVLLSFVLVALTGYALHSRLTFRQPMGVVAVPALWPGDVGQCAAGVRDHLDLAYAGRLADDLGGAAGVGLHAGGKFWAQPLGNCRAAGRGEIKGERR